MYPGASTSEEVKKKLEEFPKKLGKKYPYVVKSWETNWETFIVFLDIH